MFNIIRVIINVKEKYLDEEENKNQEMEISVFFPELTHGLNHGLIKISDDVIIYYSFSPSQFGDSFDEGYTQCLQII